VCLSPDGTTLYSIQEGPGSGAKGSIIVWSVNTATGTLTKVEAIEPGIELKHAVVSPDGLNLYVSEQGGKKILQYARNTETGELTAMTPAFIEPGEGSKECSWLVISANGKYIYGAMRGSEQVAQLERSPSIYY
jgi:6-phosphogluconolactonase (cycloisomerase 2 family)